MTDALPSALPQPIVFSVDRSQRARLRAHLVKTNGLRRQLCSNVFFASIGIFDAIGLARIDGLRALSWIAAVFIGACFVFVTLRALQLCAVPRQPTTTLSFDETGFSLVRSGPRRSETRVACTRVRSVSLTSDTLGIYGAWRTYAVIPRTALPDGGTHVMRFFAERIVSQGLSGQTSHGVTTLVNSITPLFGRA